MVEHRTERRAAAVADPVLHEVELDDARAREHGGERGYLEQVVGREVERRERVVAPQPLGERDAWLGLGLGLG